jgi:hypothetical protein
MHLFVRIQGKIAAELPKPGYEIDKLPSEIINRFLKVILPILQQRHEITVRTEIVSSTTDTTLQKLRIRCEKVELS